MRTRPRPQVTTPFFVWRAIFERLFTDATLSRLKKLTATATPGMGTSNFIDEASTSAGPGSDTASKASSRSDLSRSQQTAAYYGAGTAAAAVGAPAAAGLASRAAGSSRTRVKSGPSIH